MTFRILVHPKAAKAIAGLPKAHQRKLANLVETLKENPVPFKRFDIKKLKGYEKSL
ncbi:MAG: type II toxin-antitoxin system RelE/ParE family toxin [Archaeoglobales archaeon]|nr:MAG: type II toxin-antitoxin system RelE/ParE family toxin [Archaeoglobales archaeon]